MEKIEGLEVQNHKDSSRILNIQLDDDIVKKLIVIAAEEKPTLSMLITIFSLNTFPSPLERMIGSKITVLLKALIKTI